LFAKIRAAEEPGRLFGSSAYPVIRCGHTGESQGVSLSPYVFIGGFGEDDDMYSKIQFITTITNIIAVAIEK
jgi:hypothetical protein